MNFPRGQGFRKRPFGHQLVDRRLIPRIEQYLIHGCRGRVPDAEEISDYLCMMYPEYRRKKRKWFVPSVIKALAILRQNSSNEETRQQLLEQWHLERNRSLPAGFFGEEEEVTNDVSSSESDVEILEPKEPLVNVKDSNSINRSVHDLYSRSLKESHTESTPSSKAGGGSSNIQRKDDGKIGTMATMPQSGANIIKDSTKRDDKQGRPSVNGRHDAIGHQSTDGSNDYSQLYNQKVNKPHENFIEIIDVPSSPPETKKEDSGTSDIPTGGKPSPGKAKPPKRKAIKRKADTLSGTEEEDPRSTKSAVTFKDIGGCENCLEEVSKLVLHMKHPEVFHQLGVEPPRGFLLHGPPGCGKTLLANAIAGELQLPFYKVAATEMVSGVSGQSEEKIRDIFNEAKARAPSVLFFDEIDAITPKRETAAREMERRIVAQLLFCLDDLVNSEAHVLVIGATNRPDSLDPALRRAGRFDREICMGIPDRKARSKIMKIQCRSLRLRDGFDYEEIASLTPGFVGADLMALTREAAMCAVDRVFREMNERTKSFGETSAGGTVSSEPSVNETSSKGDTPADNATTETSNGSATLTVSVTDEVGTSEAAASEASGKPPVQDSSGATATSDEPAAMETEEQKPSTSEQKEKEDIDRVLENEVWQKMTDEPPLSQKQLEDMYIEVDDFKAALPLVQPSAKREGFATIPDVSWNDIGALEDIKEELSMSVLAPVKHQEQFDLLGLSSPPGILLAGPPGCGKTLVAKAVANEAGINFISVKGPELLNMYVGESERAVRQVFQRARNSAPCVIFFDEIDALCPKRSDMAESSASSRVVNQLLTEMDGLEVRKQVFLMGATNRPDIIDPAVLRPGRLDKRLYIGLPTKEDRLKILSKITKDGAKPKLCKKVDLSRIADDDRCEGFSGADLAALVREAATNALREHFKEPIGGAHVEIVVKEDDFEAAFVKVKPSVSAKDKKWYEKSLSNLK